MGSFLAAPFELWMTTTTSPEPFGFCTSVEFRTTQHHVNYTQSVNSACALRTLLCMSTKPNPPPRWPHAGPETDATDATTLQGRSFRQNAVAIRHVSKVAEPESGMCAAPECHKPSDGVSCPPFFFLLSFCMFSTWMEVSWEISSTPHVVQQ